MDFIHYLLVEDDNKDLKGKVWKAINQLDLKRPNKVFQGDKGSIANTVFIVPGTKEDQQKLQEYFGDQATVEFDKREGTGSVSRPKEPSMVLVRFHGINEQEEEQLSAREKREQKREKEEEIRSLQRSSDADKRRLAQLKKQKQQLDQQIEQMENKTGQGE